MGLEKTRHPGIYKRAGARATSYYVVWEYRGSQHKKAFPRLADALEFKGQVATGTRQPVRRVSFEDYAREWIERFNGRTSRGFRESTREDYRRSLEQRAIPYFGRKHRFNLADITPRDIANYVAWLCDEKEQGIVAERIRRTRVAEKQSKPVTAIPSKPATPVRLSDSTIRNQLAPIKSMFGTALEEGLVRTNPTTGARISRPAAHFEQEDQGDKVRALESDELARLLGALPERERLFFEFLAHTGLRISEAVALDGCHVEFGDKPKLLVRRQLYRGRMQAPKSKKGRRDIPLSPSIARRLWTAQRPADAPLFPTAKGARLHPSNLYSRVLHPAAESVGLEWVNFHTFRHTCASLLFRSGKSVKQVQEWLGHAKAGFTLDTYIHLIDGGLGDAAFLDEAVTVTKNDAPAEPQAPKLASVATA